VDTTELAVNLRAQLQLQRKLNAALRENGIMFYEPYDKQDEFHRSTAKRRAFFAGNRAGKSQAGCAECVAWLLGERPWYKRAFDVRGVRGWKTVVVRRHEGGENHPAVRSGLPDHPVKLLTISEDWDIVDRVWTTERGDKPGKVWRYLPKGFVKSVRRNHSRAIDMIECANGSTWNFDVVQSYKNDPRSFESADWDAIHVDEPCPEDMFKAAARGLIDRKGHAWFMLTPLSEPWIMDYFETFQGAWTITGSTYDNPYLTKEGVREFEQTLTEDERQCRLFGIPMHLVGRIYKEFDNAKHVLHELPKGWKSWMEPPLDWSYYIQIDPHPQTPHCVLFLTVAPAGEVFVYYDLFEHCRISELARQIRDVLGPRRPARVEADPAAWIEHPVDGTTMASEFWSCGVMVEKATKALDYGILQVKAALVAEPQRLWFAPTAKRTLWELPRYSWDDKRPNKPIDKDDHAMECLYRAMLMHPVWIDQSNFSVPVEDMAITGPAFEQDELVVTFDEDYGS